MSKPPKPEVATPALAAAAGVKPRAPAPAYDESKLAALLDAGFARADALAELERQGGNERAALEALLLRALPPVPPPPSTLDGAVAARPAVDPESRQATWA